MPNKLVLVVFPLVVGLIFFLYHFWMFYLGVAIVAMISGAFAE